MRVCGNDVKNSTSVQPGKAPNDTEDDGAKSDAEMTPMAADGRSQTSRGEGNYLATDAHGCTQIMQEMKFLPNVASQELRATEHTERHGRKREKIDPQMTQMAADGRSQTARGEGNYLATYEHIRTQIMQEMKDRPNAASQELRATEGTERHGRSGGKSDAEMTSMAADEMTGNTGSDNQAPRRWPPH
jgi:hypothetical protein